MRGGGTEFKMKVVQKILAALLIAAVMGCWMGVVTLADPVDETD